MYTMKLKVNIALVIFFLSLPCAYSPTNWRNISSSLSFEKIVFNHGNIFAQTDLGISSFDTDSQKFNSQIIENLDCIVSDFEIINDELWILCSNGNLINHTKNLILNHLIIDSAYDITIYENSVFMLYLKNGVEGLIEINYNQNQLVYKDYYEGFASFGTSFSKSLIFQNKIYLQSNNGIYVGDFENNLKNNSSWIKLFNSSNVQDIVIFNNQLFAICSDGVRVLDENQSFDNVLELQIDLTNFIDSFNYNDSYLYFLLDNKILKLDSNYQKFIDYELSLSQASSIIVENDVVYLAHQDQGLWILNNDITKCSPNTILSSSIESLTLSDNVLYGVSREGVFIYDGEIFENIISNNYESSYLTKKSNCNNFIGTQLDYVPGSKISSSIIVHDDILFIPNSGILPDEDNKGGLVLVDPLNKVLIDVIGSNYLEGLDGIYYEDLSNNYLTINQILKDDNDNIWIVNPYSETNKKILKYFNASNFSWNSIIAPDDTSYLPQEIAFDQWGRIWVAFRNESTINGNFYSSGGIKLVTSDGNWLNIDNLESLPGNNAGVNVWSLDFGKFDNKDILWILTSNGVQGYSITGNRIDPIYPVDFFSNIPFQKGDKIRVDPSNNVWITTNHSGLRVIKNDLTFWPSQDGITKENSELITDGITDIVFDYENSRVFLSTNQGLSVFNVPFSKNSNFKGLGVSPNPFILSKHQFVEIENITSDSEIVIMTLDGKVVKNIKVPSNENKVIWNGLDSKSKSIETGIYLIVVKKQGIETNLTKLAIIK